MDEHFRRHVLVNVGIILGSFVVFGAVFYFMTQALSAKTGQIIADRTAIGRRSADLEALASLKADAPRAAELQEKIDALLPNQDGVIGFPQFMNATARTHSLGLAFSFSGPPQPPAANSAGRVPFNASVDGSAENIRNFVNDLETRTTRFLITVSEINLTPQGGGFRADLRGQVYFRANET